MSEINRLDARFAKLKEDGKKAFISFTTAGYPNLDLFPELLQKLPKAGVDIIEIGMPFSDPVADGKAIQEANIEAFKAGITVPKILDMVEAFREVDQETPIILMGYYNPIYSYGLMKFLDDTAKIGVDAFIIPDVPPEEDEEFRKPAEERGMHVIRLVTPTTDADRLPVVLKDAKGFLYCVSVTGITGGKKADPEELKTSIRKLRAKSDLPIAIGFGTSTPDEAHIMANASDGAIVGSAIMKRIAGHIDDNGIVDSAMLNDVLGFVKELADGAHQE